MEASSNQLSFLVVNPRFTDPHVSELEALAARIIDAKPDVLYMEINSICGKWISEKLKEEGIAEFASTPSNDSTKYWMQNKKRIEMLNGAFYYGGSKFDAYKGAIKDLTTNKVYVFGMAILHSSGVPLTKDIRGNQILQRHGLDKWFDLKQQLKEYTKSDEETLPTTNWSNITYDNIMNILPKSEKPKEEKAEHEHHGISALIHKVIDKKKEPVNETPPVHVANAININTIYCGVRMEKEGGSDHVIDNGEKLHHFVFKEEKEIRVSHRAF